MKNWWIKSGCFLTGYKYEILAGCSEIAQRAVKRYTSALLIICVLWAFIGYCFVSKYLKGEWYISIFGAILFILIILQVERQIILADAKGKAKYWIRGLIAVIMAIIGSIVIDQIIFQQDIAHKQKLELNTEVDVVLPAKQAELRRQTTEIDSSISKKEAERAVLLDELSKHPTIQMVTKEKNNVPITSTTIDSNKLSKTNTVLVKTRAVTVTSVPNPKMSIVPSLDQQIKELRTIKTDQENRLIKLRNEVEQDVKADKGFLYELQLMYRILHDSGPALFVWALWFLLLLGIEIFIMVNKLSHLETDYDVCIHHHMELQKRKLKLLAMQVPEV
ncbi:DUF4407 domain-containing protein [Mucilaginibacter rubeus]|uniref:DUF4407 domain-containing protein n=1 Tax=Mucilaginibacter rubeus TaxID=2027860 RepID=UPI0016678260|nr:DUF4407 domain-containing protein [Mucilaginibacter rubeus]GGB22843.1 hypothetical protein GCM10011500_43750 [Mucilaginibacter rubeus]